MSKTAIKLLVVVQPDDLTEEENVLFWEEVSGLHFTEDINAILEPDGFNWKLYADPETFPDLGAAEVVTGSPADAARSAVLALQASSVTA